MGREASNVQRFQKLFDVHGESILLYFKRRTSTEAAREGTADTFLVAWRRIADIPVDNELPWLYGVARRVLSQQRRTQKRRYHLFEKLAGSSEVAEPSPETIVVRAAEHADVLDAVSRLRPQEQELLRLAAWDELPHSEIAEILGCSAHAVDQRLYRAKRQLAREMRAAGHKPVRHPINMPESGEDAT